MYLKRSQRVATGTKPLVGPLAEPPIALKSQNSLSASLRRLATSGEPLFPRAFCTATTKCPKSGGGVRLGGGHGLLGFVVRQARLLARMILSPSSAKIWFAVVARIGLYRCNSSA